MEQICFRAFFMPSYAERAAGASSFISNIHQGIEKRGCFTVPFFYALIRVSMYPAKDPADLFHEEERGRGSMGTRSPPVFVFVFCNTMTK